MPNGPILDTHTRRSRCLRRRCRCSLRFWIVFVSWAHFDKWRLSLRNFNCSAQGARARTLTHSHPICVQCDVMWNCSIYFRLNVSHGYKLLASFQHANASAIIDVFCIELHFCSWHARAHTHAHHFFQHLMLLSFASFSLSRARHVRCIHTHTWMTKKKIVLALASPSTTEPTVGHFSLPFLKIHFIFIWICKIDTSFHFPDFYICVYQSTKQKSQNRQRGSIRARALASHTANVIISWGALGNAQHSKHTNYLFSLILFIKAWGKRQEDRRRKKKQIRRPNQRQTYRKAERKIIEMFHSNCIAWCGSYGNVCVCARAINRTFTNKPINWPNEMRKK